MLICYEYLRECVYECVCVIGDLCKYEFHVYIISMYLTLCPIMTHLLAVLWLILVFIFDCSDFVKNFMKYGIDSGWN